MTTQLKITAFFGTPNDPPKRPTPKVVNIDLDEDDTDSQPACKLAEKSSTDLPMFLLSDDEDSQNDENVDHRKDAVVVIDEDEDTETGSKDNSNKRKAADRIDMDEVGANDVDDADYDSDEVQKPRDKAKLSALVKRRTPKKSTAMPLGSNSQDAGEAKMEDGIIGMKVRSPSNGRA